MTSQAHGNSVPHSIAAHIEGFGKRKFLTTRDIFQSFLDLSVELMGCEIGYLHGFKSGSAEIQLNVWSSSVYEKCKAVNDSHYQIREAGIWADAIRLNETVVHNNYPKGASDNGMPDGHFTVGNHMSSPIHSKGEITAVIGVGNKPIDFTQADVLALERIIKLGWPVVLDRLNEHGGRAKIESLTYNHRNPKDVLIAMVQTVSKALELRDEYTSHHQTNVAKYAGMISSVLGLPKEQMFGIHLGALVHDIGKIAIPSQILAKPGKLSRAELLLIQTHPELGAEIFGDVDLPWPIVDMIHQHHERMDGTGYPRQLVGESICLEARIIAVADTFDAISSDRPYRHAPGRDFAIKVLKDERGRSYDNDVVGAFLMAIENDPGAVPGPAKQYMG